MNSRKYIPGGMREIIAIAFPMLVSFACDTVMTFTDRLFLSRLEPELMNAALAGGLTVFVMMSFMLGLAGYVTALVAQYLGSGQKSKCSVALSQALFAIVLFYPIILLCRPLGHWVFDWMGITQAQLIPQKQYFDILLYGTLISLFRHAFSSFFSGIGRTRVVMLSAIVTMTVNMGVNYLLIYGKWGFPMWGIRGAAIGTILGAVCGLLVLVIAYVGKDNRKEFSIGQSLRFDRSVMSTFFKFGYPAGVEFLLNLIAFDALILFFHAVDEIVATASTIMFNWDMVSFVPLMGVEIGVTSLVGRYMGARDPDTAQKAALSGVKLGLLYSSFVLVAFVLFPQILVDVFRPATGSEGTFTEARPLAVFMVRVASFYVLIQSFFLVLIGALRGAGDTHWSMRFSVAVHWTLALTTGVSLHVFHLNPRIAWLLLVANFVVSSCLLFRRFRQGHWKTIQVVDSPDTVLPSSDHFHMPPDL